MLEAFLVSTSIVALAEMGDKTQLLSFVLAAKLKHRVPIVLGILVATLANHFLAGWIGAWLATLVSPTTLRWTIAASFVVFGLWALKPDELEEDQKLRGAGVFLTTLVAFFFVEMGDKTQLATVALAARYTPLSPWSRDDARDDDRERARRLDGRGPRPPRQHEVDAVGGGGALHRPGRR